jgi:uncharacterized protein YjaZ
MVDIKIDCKVRVSEKRFQLIKKVAEYCLNDLNLPKVVINVEYASDMGNSDGLCYGQTFIDIVNKRNTDSLIDTIAHEIRHCYQHFYKTFNMDKKAYKNCGYNMLPWEIDAAGYASKVVKYFKNKS